MVVLIFRLYNFPNVDELCIKILGYIQISKLNFMEYFINACEFRLHKLFLYQGRSDWQIFGH